jgi:phosphate-selective porin OprO/OprP
LAATIVPATQAAGAQDPASPTSAPDVVRTPVLPEPSVVLEAQDAKSDALDARLRGRIEADAIMVDQDEKNKLLYGNFLNAVGFRRVRLGAEGTAGEQVHWVGELDFADGVLALKDAFVGLKKLPLLREARVGHQLEPFSLEGHTSSVWFPFAERSPGMSLDPARNWGVSVLSYLDDQRVIFQAGAFRSATDINGADVGDGNDMAYTGRIVVLPMYEEIGESMQLLHIGGAASQRYAKNDLVTFNQSPQSTLLQTGDNPLIPFVPNIAIPATQSQLYNLQAALVLGPLSFQAEWNGANLDQIDGGPVLLQGAYVLVSYFLTGEHRAYNREVGTFARTRVIRPFICQDDSNGIGRGSGAWELTARWAGLDFDSSNLATDANGLKVGNRLTTWTLGLNWYLNDHARLMFNYLHAVPGNPNFGNSAANAFTIRSAIFW